MDIAGPSHEELEQPFDALTVDLVERLLTGDQSLQDEHFDAATLSRDIANAYQTVVDHCGYQTVILDSNITLSSDSAPSYGDCKSNVLSKRFRDTATTLLKNEKLDEALVLFTQGVACAATGSEELAWAFADRSYALFRLTKYASCVMDINRALLGQCTEYLRKKLRDRKRRCLLQHRAMCVSDDSNRINSEAADPSELIGLNEHITGWREFCNFSPPNDFLPNTSPKIRLQHSEEWGRHMVAVKDIDPGKFADSTAGRRNVEGVIMCTYVYS